MANSKRKKNAGHPAFQLAAGTTLLLAVATAGAALAQNFRAIQPIASPDVQLALPEGAVPVENPTPVPRKVVETKLRKIIERWNSPRMAQTMADSFYDKSRLLDAVEANVPRDAQLKLQSIQSVRTVQQYMSEPSEYGPQTRTSIVSAVAQTQLEFNSPTGFVRLPGVNEFILRITEMEQP